MMQPKVKQFFIPLLGILFLLFLILYMSGFFASGLIGPEDEVAVKSESPEPARVAEAKLTKVHDWYEAIGTIRSSTLTKLESRITARIEEILVRPGQEVSKGELLIKLNDELQRSRLEQVEDQVQASQKEKMQAFKQLDRAKAVYNQTKSQYNRIKEYKKADAATEKDLEDARSAYLQAEAALKSARYAFAAAEHRLSRVKEKLKEARIFLSYASIKSPISGEIVKKMADSGDLASPGKPLISIQNRQDLRLEAWVREGVIANVQVGNSYQVQIPALQEVCRAEIVEIVPQADPGSRKILIKAALPDIKNVYSGMFGRLHLPVEARQAVLVPKQAVMEIGQLDLVRIKTEQGWESVLVTTGQEFDNYIEVLSGLSGQEKIALVEGEDG